MPEQRTKTQVAVICRLARRRVAGPLARCLERSNAEELGEAVSQLRKGETLFLFNQIDDDSLAGELLLELSETGLSEIVEEIDDAKLKGWMGELEPDDAADVAARLPEELQEQILGMLEDEDREEVEELMAWPEDSAGGIMSPVAFRMLDSATCREAIEALHEQGDVEMVFYIYLLNEADQLVGTCSLRNLLVNSPSTLLREIMTTDVVSVTPEMDQEEVARLTARFDLLAIPVVDDSHQLIGIVTVDDVIDVIRDEAAEDLMLMAGVSEGYDPQEASAITAVRERIRWLFVTLLAGMALVTIIGRFDEVLNKNLILAGLIPVLLAMSGNVGIQASTITVRNLVTNQVAVTGGTMRLVVMEARIGLLLGIVFGLLLGAWTLLLSGELPLSMAVATSIAVAVTVASVVGTLTPIVLDKFGVDPAVAAGPFVTTVVDLAGVVVFFSIVWAWPGL